VTVLPPPPPPPEFEVVPVPPTFPPVPPPTKNASIFIATSGVNLPLVKNFILQFPLPSSITK
jgi:hypothetical protein